MDSELPNTQWSTVEWDDYDPVGRVSIALTEAVGGDTQRLDVHDVLWENVPGVRATNMVDIDIQSYIQECLHD